MTRNVADWPKFSSTSISIDVRFDALSFASAACRSPVRYSASISTVVLGSGSSAQMSASTAVAISGPRFALITITGIFCSCETARTLMLLGEPDAAERAYRRELEFNPNDFDANLQLGNLRKSAQRFAEAGVAGE